VSATTPALIAAAAGVGFGHAIMPDHWVPLAVLGRTRHYPPARVARLSGLAGVAHVLVSVVVGSLVVAIGLQLRGQIETAQDTIVGALLIATGVGFLAVEARGHRHGHGHGHHHRHLQVAAKGRLRNAAAIMVPFGAAASPDLTILPVFLAAAGVGTGAAAGSLAAFALVTIITIVGLTLLATFGGYQIRGRWLERWGNAITALVLFVIGLLVITRTL
jgi:nickel/cobalt exporter